MILTAINREASEARGRNRPPVRIRVTASAIPGSLCAVPLAVGSRYDEIVVHPDDWDGRSEENYQFVCGLPVVREA
jgi:hypothetical protein